MASDTGVPLSLFAPPRITAEKPGDGLVLRSAEPLGPHPVTVVHSMREHARADPDHLLVAERHADPAAGWRGYSYGAAAKAADAIGQALLDRGLGPDRPLLILSANSVDHLLITLGATTAGVPVAPASAAYSLQSRDHARLRAITELIPPGAVFAEGADRFAPALDSLAAVPAFVSRGSRPGAALFADLLAPRPGPEVAAA